MQYLDAQAPKRNNNNAFVQQRHPVDVMRARLCVCVCQVGVPALEFIRLRVPNPKPETNHRCVAAGLHRVSFYDYDAAVGVPVLEDFNYSSSPPCSGDGQFFFFSGAVFLWSALCSRCSWLFFFRANHVFQELRVWSVRVYVHSSDTCPAFRPDFS